MFVHWVQQQKIFEPKGLWSKKIMTQNANCFFTFFSLNDTIPFTLHMENIIKQKEKA